MRVSRLISLCAIATSTALIGCGSDSEPVDIAVETANAIAACGSFLEYNKGTLPIILTNPHGASASDPSTLIPGVRLRTGEPFQGFNGGFVSGFVTRSDENTDLATDFLANRIEALTGERPYVIKARFRRSQIDANRPAPNAVNVSTRAEPLVNLAYEDPAASDCYNAFYYAINETITEVRENFGRGFILDVHSTINLPSGLARGTVTLPPEYFAETLKELIGLYGDEVQTGPNSLFGLIAARGIETLPANQADGDTRRFTAGYLVQHWGGFINPRYPSIPINTIDAIQMEISRSITLDSPLSVLEDTMNTVGEAVVEYYDLWYAD